MNNQEQKIDTAKMASDLDIIENCIKAITEVAAEPLTITSYEGDGREQLDGTAKLVNTDLNNILTDMNDIKTKIEEIKTEYNLRISQVTSLGTNHGGGGSNGSSTNMLK